MSRGLFFVSSLQLLWSKGSIPSAETMYRLCDVKTVKRMYNKQLCRVCFFAMKMKICLGVERFFWESRDFLRLRDFLWKLRDFFESWRLFWKLKVFLKVEGFFRVERFFWRVERLFLKLRFFWELRNLLWEFRDFYGS